MSHNERNERTFYDPMPRIEHEGPAYPKLGTRVAKYRKFKSPTREQRREHGDAVHEAFKALQRRELMRVVVEPPSPDYSYNHQRALLKAAQRRICNPDAIRAKRTPYQWQALYDEAMKQRNTCLTQAA